VQVTTRRSRADDRPSHYIWRQTNGTSVHYSVVPLASPGVREVWDDKQQDGRTLRTVFGEVEEGF
jgi:hypothetical protein